MADLPILFSGPMALANWQHRKTETRRILKPSPRGTPWFWEGDEVDPEPQWFDGWEEGREPCGASTRERNAPIPLRWSPGDRLWVREGLRCDDGRRWLYAADNSLVSLPVGDPRISGMVAWAHHQERASVTSIHMPRWASRMTLLVSGVRIERLRDITREGALSEGCSGGCGPGYDFALHSYMVLWNKINRHDSPNGWEANPWAAVIQYSVERRNIDCEEPIGGTNG